MRFMMLLKASRNSEAGVMPTLETMEAIGKYHEDMVKSGVLLDAAGLYPSSNGARIRFSGDQRTVVDGPFVETKELIGGFWMIQVKSRAEAIEWAKRCPAPAPGEEAEIEVRQVVDISDFPETIPSDLSDLEKEQRYGTKPDAVKA